MSGSILHPSKAKVKQENVSAKLLKSDLKLSAIKCFSPPPNQTCLATSVSIYPNFC